MIKVIIGLVITNIITLLVVISMVRFVLKHFEIAIEEVYGVDVDE